MGDLSANRFFAEEEYITYIIGNIARGELAIYDNLICSPKAVVRVEEKDYIKSRFPGCQAGSHYVGNNLNNRTFEGFVFYSSVGYIIV